MSNLLNSKLAAEKLGVSVRRVQFLITNGQLKAEKFGRDYMIRESDLPKLEKRKRGRRVGSKTKKPDAPEMVKPDVVASEPKTLLSIEAAAAFMKCTENEIKKLIRNGLRTEKGKINEKDLTAVK